MLEIGGVLWIRFCRRCLVYALFPLKQLFSACPHVIRVRRSRQEAMLATVSAHHRLANAVHSAQVKREVTRVVRAESLEAVLADSL